MRGLGIKQVMSWILLAAVVLAIFQGYHGDVGKMVAGLWGFIETLAGVFTNIWRQAKG